MNAHIRHRAKATAGAYRLPAREDGGRMTISADRRYRINRGMFEGWGTTLCWWANRIGYSDALAQLAAELCYGKDGLRLNIARFNIGGGDDPAHTHITRTDSNMPGYTVFEDGRARFDWSADHNQRNVLRRCIAACGDEMIVEMFSNSPPYYMTKSGCTSGAVRGQDNNLREECYDGFAAYLAEVCAHYQREWGISVQSVEALNEPYTDFWYAQSPKQEGCHFDLGECESRIILALRRELDARGLGGTLVCGTDETAVVKQVLAWLRLSGDARAALGRIDTHTYTGYGRPWLRALACRAGMNLWMSEVDAPGVIGEDAGEMGAALTLAAQITRDLNGLEASAWILWQVIDSHICAAGLGGRQDTGMVDTRGGYWGTAVADHDKGEIVLTKKFYALGQYSRYIRPGMTMLRTDGHAVAAYDAAGRRLVVTAYNAHADARAAELELEGFRVGGAQVRLIRTSARESWAEVDGAALAGNVLRVELAGNSITTVLVDGIDRA